MSKNFKEPIKDYKAEKEYIPEKNCKLVAIDTNVFIDMSHMKNGEEYRHQKGVDARVKEKIYDLVEMCKNGQVKFVILPTVFNELNVHGMSQKEKEFMEKYCVLFQPKNKIEFAKQSVSLSRRYIGEGVMKGSSTPFGDALIMAETAISGLNLLTNNYKDFVIYDREKFVRDNYGDIVPNKQFFKYDPNLHPTNVENYKEKDIFNLLVYKQRTRAIDIASVNEKANYVYETKNGYRLIPMPFTTMDYVGRAHDKSGLFRTEQFNTSIDNSKFFLAQYENEY